MHSSGATSSSSATTQAYLPLGLSLSFNVVAGNCCPPAVTLQDWTLRSCWHQTQVCDLGRCTESFRRAPVSGSSTRINPKGLQPIQPRSERLLQSNEEIPRPELPAVRVAGELQLKSRLQRRFR